MQSGVRWEATVRRLAELGVDTAIEIGPGRVLTGFVKKTVGNAISVSYTHLVALLAIPPWIMGYFVPKISLSSFLFFKWKIRQDQSVNPALLTL